MSCYRWRVERVLCRADVELWQRWHSFPQLDVAYLSCDWLDRPGGPTDSSPRPEPWVQGASPTMPAPEGRKNVGFAGRCLPPLRGWEIFHWRSHPRLTPWAII